MEHIEGVTLFRFQKNQIFISIELVKYLAAYALSMIEQLHDMGIVFRDLKSENIML